MKIGDDNCHKCIHSSVCTWYGAEYCDWYVNTCGDAVSREAAIEAIEALQRPIMREESNYYQFKFSGMSEAREAVENLPSVTPQPTTGRWIAQDIHNCHTDFKCSECGYIYSFMHLYGKPTADYTYCPNCGTKMEVQE